jgi:NTE family protein
MQGLSEIGYKPDTITGSSAGALIGALYAAGMRPPEMVRLISSLQKRDFWEGSFFSHVLKPLHRGRRYSGMLSGKNLRKLLVPYLGGLELEDLPIPMGIAASNITRGRKELIRTGSVIDAVLASMAFPILFEMQQLGTDEYLDGGVADHEPVTEFIMDPSVGHILVHAIESHAPPARLALKRAFAGGVAVIDHETRQLKEHLARWKKKPILRITTTSHALGPDRLDAGMRNVELGRRSAHQYEDLIRRGARNPERLPEN